MNKNKKIVLVILLFIACFVLSGCASTDYITKPLGDGFGFWDIFVYPMAGIMWLVGNSIGFHNYAVTIILSTLIVRTIAWPIYAKSNDMQLKMKLMQPEIDKIQAKYAEKKDQESQQRMQMETMQVYKKYGVGVGGCVMPFIQMPIFLGFYYAIRKLPACMLIEGHWLNIFTSKSIFGIDMTLAMSDEGATQAQKVGVIVLAVLVGVTQVVSILISELRQKKATEEQQKDVPMYRRPQQNPQAKSSATTMKVMMYAMAAMMVVFVIQSPAGLGLYWVIGNIYSTLQSWIGQVTSEKRMEKLKKKIH